MLVHKEIVEIRSALHIIRTSVKRRDVFEAVFGEMDMKQNLSSLDVETRCLSTFNMITKMYTCGQAVNATINRMVEPADLSIPERWWAYKVCNFLESSAQIIETQSSSNYITLSRTSKLLQLLVKKYKTVIQDNDTLLIQIASSMIKRHEQYAVIVESPLKNMEKWLDPRFSSDILRDSDAFRKYVTMTLCNVTTTSNVYTPEKIFYELYDEDSLHALKSPGL